jgi:hypothetical protein
MIFARTAFVAAGILLAGSLPTFAEDTSAPASPAETPTLAADANKPEMTPEERAEREARKACKVKICDILATKDPQGDVNCSLAQHKGGDPYAVEISIAPKVAFENGKAASAYVNWGEAKAPMLAYALIYAGTRLDNSTNVLGPEVTRMVNEFTSRKCKKLKDDLPSNTRN